MKVNVHVNDLHALAPVPYGICLLCFITLSKRVCVFPNAMGVFLCPVCVTQGIGSGTCLQQPPCTTTDYFYTHTPCDSSGQVPQKIQQI